MSKGPLVTFLIFAAICAVAIPYLAISKEGAEGSAPVTVDPRDEEGKELFAANCGACHTLAAAGTEGVVGPNLDVVLSPGGIASFEGSYGRALTAVTCGFGGGRMPAGILTGENAKDVAAFVGAYAGQVGANPEPLANTETVEKPEPPSCGASDESGSTDSASTDSGS